MPSKLLIAAGNAAKAAADAHKFGIITTGITVNDAAVMARIRKHHDKFVESTRQTICALTQDAKLTGRARFVHPPLYRSVSAP